MKAEQEMLVANCDLPIYIERLYALQRRKRHREYVRPTSADAPQHDNG